MAKVNKHKPTSVKTHEGALTVQAKPLEQLKRSVMACMLWEDTFYEDGESIAERIKYAIANVTPEQAADVAIEAREKMKLRHVPLLIVREMARLEKFKILVSSTLSRVIQRADELTEFVAIYWKEKKQPLSAQVKKGLASAFRKFNGYQLAKYNRDESIKLRDVLFLCHAKPKDDEQKKVWKNLVDGTLTTPDTWEVSLSAGKNKKETWERLISENKLGALALLRNLRNMIGVDVQKATIGNALLKADYSRVLPFRFVSAAKAAPALEEQIDAAMMKCISQKEKIPGKTVFIIDVSGSMYGTTVSKKSDMDRALAACALGAIGRECCEEVSVYATAGSDSARKHKTELVPNRHGMALVDAIFEMCSPLGGGGIFLNQVCNFILEKEKYADRTIVITDEQDCAVDGSDSPQFAKPLGRGYIINVNTYKNGIAYKKAWTHINGWSESVLDYIREVEHCNQ